MPWRPNLVSRLTLNRNCDSFGDSDYDQVTDYRPLQVVRVPGYVFTDIAIGSL